MSRSDKTGFRRYLPLLALVLVLALAAAFVWLLPAIKKTFPATSTIAQTYAPTYKTIAELDPETLETVTVTHLGEDPYTLVNQDGILSLQSEDGSLEPINTTVSDNFIKYATTIYVEDTLAEDAADLADQLSAMGLIPPQITATAVFADGSKVTILLGSTMLDTTYHYYMWSGDNGLYLCNTGVYETFENTADMLRSITQPPIIASLVESVNIEHAGETPIVCSLETDEDDAVQGTLQSPYAYPMQAQAAKALLSAVDSFRLGARLRPMTDETRSLYGFDTPEAVVTINQRGGQFSQVSDSGALSYFTLEPSSVTLTLGNADGEFFRYCEYEGNSYRVSAFLVNAFLTADAADYAATNPADLGADTLTGITVQTGDGTLEIRASYVENVLPNNELEYDEYGNIVYTTEVTANGEPVTVEAFEELVARLQQMSVSGTLDSETAPVGTPLWRMALETAQGENRRLAAYPMDAFNDVLAVDGVAVHYISKEALEIALGEFSALLTPVSP